MKKNSWQIVLGIILIFISATAYYIHFLIFRDLHHILIYLVGDIAFVFLEVLLVTLVLHNLLEIRECRTRLEKLNMVIGAFFSEVGTRLIILFQELDQPNGLKTELNFNDQWNRLDFNRVRNRIVSYQISPDTRKGDLEGLRSFLIQKREFLLRLLENPNLLEHELFTDLLWAVFHLTEELESRTHLDHLSREDHEHLANDIKRAYGHLLREWINYIEHLKNNYPFLFSLSSRTNPFNPDARVEIGERG